MDRFVVRENIKRYLELLRRTSDEQARAQLCALLAEEQRKAEEQEAKVRARTDVRDDHPRERQWNPL